MTKKGGKVSYILFPLEKVRGPLPQLQEADIILVHTKRSFLRYFLRRVTKSYWDHVALVLFPKNLKNGQFYNQIIEAVDPRGIEIHKFDKYLKDSQKYDIGIKRIAHLDQATRRRIVAFMLMNVDAPYYKLSIIRFIVASISRRFSEWLLGRQRFCCSGFVQRSFYEATNWNERERFIFREEYLSPMELQDITTPGDIAKSDKAMWVYNKH